MYSTNKLFRKNLNRTDGLVLAFTAILTTFASEIKVIPFDGEVFRFGLGSITFFLLILIWPPLSLIRSGFVTGLTAICFRIAEDIVLDDVQVLTSFIHHVPTFFFYFIFALGLHMIKVEQYKTLPLILGAWATLFEIIGNGAEQLTRDLLSHHEHLGLKSWALVSGVALLRSYFVVGLYSSITVAEQKKRMQEMLSVGSELYAETLYLQKSMDHIEQITASSHELYRKLKREELQELSVQALHIAQQIHEVKKDSQRILAGISKVTEQKRAENLFLSDVLNLVMTANEKYSRLLKKNILFQLSMSIEYETDQQIPLLALLNNLTANAVEAIVEKGEIKLELFETAAHTCFVIIDSGKGIPKEDVSIIFEPGYTTKFNDHGVAATGIGLSHVQEIVQSLEGQIHIETSEKGSVFRIEIPTVNLTKVS